MGYMRHHAIMVTTASQRRRRAEKEMSVHLSVSALRNKPLEEATRKMLRIRSECLTTGVMTPREAERFFDEHGAYELLEEVNITGHPCCTRYSTDADSGFDIELSKIPPGVTHIRFVASD